MEAAPAKLHLSPRLFTPNHNDHPTKPRITRFRGTTLTSPSFAAKVVTISPSCSSSARRPTSSPGGASLSRRCRRFCSPAGGRDTGSSSSPHSTSNEGDAPPPATSPPPPPSVDPPISSPSSQKQPHSVAAAAGATITLPSSTATPSSYNDGLVFHLGPAGSWDSREVGSPVVKRYVSDDEERWFMWYHGTCDAAGNASDAVGLAVSSNGIHWERGPGPVVETGEGTGLVMRCSDDWWAFDTHSVRPAEVIIMSSSKVRAAGGAVYWLYYTGFSPHDTAGDNPGGVDGPLPLPLRSMPGLAISQDGRYWARIEGEHHSGALFDVGADSEWDSLFVAAPKVVYHERGDLRMYYHSFDATSGQHAIGMGRSRDGIRWVKLGKVMGGSGKAGSFDECGVLNGHVVGIGRDGGRYLMAYEGVSAEGRRSIGLAESPDGLKNWKRCGDEPLLRPCGEGGGGWDDASVGCPCLVPMDGEEGEWRLYYWGIGKQGGAGIGLAVSEDDGDAAKRFKRWAGFHL